MVQLLLLHHDVDISVDCVIVESVVGIVEVGEVDGSELLDDSEAVELVVDSDVLVGSVVVDIVELVVDSDVLEVSELLLALAAI